MSNPLKKTMVYLGLADEEEVYEEPAPQQSGRKAQTLEKAAAPVTPIHRPTVVRQPAPSAINEILTVHPKQYRDAQVIAENFRDGIPVIINLSQMSDADARRLIDFASGLSLGLYGRIERVTSKVFLLSPENVAVSGDGAVAQADAEAAPFAQP
ncbi:MAG: cell division protein SepF [Microbacterium sp.]|uniref:cell division protein SepF n=1 Tax=Microbacterium sp. TaxID=51671 RepID=UPI0009281B12|nr:cell division protein SepF [Microbacterium sp.]MBN9171436.1 cell division protein SepF [Microbacterium sp.]MBN9183551.1 cell division protein SepF [Microbacterium sp.]MBN9191074.1 cell division protein SepF [Microbacterium sp.]OJU72515.1 MAG: cell division protein SepF [Microbacterium sp. 70-38]